MFVAREAESDEPFLVEFPRRLLQQRHPPPVVLNQVVVGGKRFDDSFLNRTVWNPNLQLMQDVPVDAWNGRLVALVIAETVFEEIGSEVGMVAFEILDVKRRVVWPIIFLQIVNIS